MSHFENGFTNSSRPRRRLWAVAAVALLSLSTACARNAPQDALAPEGPIARQIHELFTPIFWIAVAIFVLVEGGLVLLMVKFRHREGGPAPRQIHGSRAMEIGWTLAPALLLAIIAIPTVLTIFALAQRPAGNPLTVKVTGLQWWWQYEYPDYELTTANELHIPTGRPVIMELAANDVIHSFWVPKLSGKQDVVPGHLNHLTIRAEKPGTYLGQCAEYCGLSHANMRLRVIAHDPGGFEQWVAEQQRPAQAPTDARAQRGLELLETGQCAGCHMVEGTRARAKVGPDLTHLMSRETFAGATFELNEANLRRWLRDPPAMKPGSKMPDLGLSEEEIDSLVAYLQTLQ